MTKEDIKRVYNDLEDGKIKNQKGLRFGDLKGYYGKVFRSKPFDMAGKTQIIKEVMEFTRSHNKEEVRFIEEETFREIVGVVIRVDQKLLCWLCFDVGENINTILHLKKNEFYREINKDTNEPEYRVNLPKDKLKRTRLTRSEITNFRETTELLDLILKDLKEDEELFKFGYAQAKKFFNRAVNIVGAKCKPKGQRVTFKDLRSSMCCWLLKHGYSIEECNFKLGHKPSSKEIDKYCNFLALDRHEPKKKIYYNNLQKVENELEETKMAIKMTSERFRKQSEEIISLKLSNEDIKLKMIKLAYEFKETIIELKKLTNIQRSMNVTENY